MKKSRSGAIIGFVGGLISLGAMIDSLIDGNYEVAIGSFLFVIICLIIVVANYKR